MTNIGWIEKAKGGKTITPIGNINGGHQMETSDGTPYVMWNQDILENEHFIRAKKIAEGELIEDFQYTGEPISDDWRKKYPASMRCTDGHYVRSKSEMLIDNFLYYKGIIHCYEMKLPVDEQVFCDFYIPKNRVYIEFWGFDENEKYLERKKGNKKFIKSINSI